MNKTLQRTLLEHGWLRAAAALIALCAVGGAAMAEAVDLPEIVIVPDPPAPLELVYPVEQRVIWDGADVDGDGAADFLNPTGEAPREHDGYGDGYFGASRDGGSRDHEGVDYTGAPGHQVKAPMSGYVTKIGQAYDDGPALRYVEISNPALSFQARVFYIDPQVRVGDSVALGDVIGKVANLNRRYRGITNHVHLEIKDQTGRRIDATKVITARIETVRVGA